MVSEAQRLELEARHGPCIGFADGLGGVPGDLLGECAATYGRVSGGFFVVWQSGSSLAAALCHALPAAHATGENDAVCRLLPPLGGLAVRNGAAQRWGAAVRSLSPWALCRQSSWSCGDAPARRWNEEKLSTAAIEAGAWIPWCRCRPGRLDWVRPQLCAPPPPPPPPLDDRRP